MQANFPDAPVTKTTAGHFLQEEVPEEIAAAIVRMVDQLTTGY
jgi:haloalkane dehalogenase